MIKTKQLILKLIYWEISFEKYVHKNLISWLYNFYFIFVVIINLKINNSQNVSTQKDYFESRLCNQTQWLYIVETFYMSQIKPKEFVHKTAYSVQLPYIAGHSL